MTVLVNGDGFVAGGPAGLGGSLMRPAGGVALLSVAAAEGGWLVSDAVVSPGVTHIWVGNGRRRPVVVAVADLPQTIPGPELMAADANGAIAIFAGAVVGGVRQPHTWGMIVPAPAPDPEPEPEPDPEPVPEPAFVSPPDILWSASPIVAGTTGSLVEAEVDDPDLLTGPIAYAFEMREPPLGDEEEWTGWPVVSVLGREYRAVAEAPWAGGVIRAETPWHAAPAASGPRQLILGVDFTVPGSEFRPADQQATFSPIVLAPGLAALLGPAGAAYVTWADNLGNLNARHRLRPHQDPALAAGGYWQCWSKFHPVAAGQTDAGIFTEGDARRVGKMRIAYGLTGDELDIGPWSDPPADVLLPAAADGPPELAMPFPALIEAIEGTTVTLSLRAYLKANGLPLSFSKVGAALATTLDAEGVFRFNAPMPAPAAGFPPGAVTITISNGIAPDLVIATAVRSLATPAQPPTLKAAFPALIEAEAGETTSIDVSQFVEGTAPLAYARSGAAAATAIGAASGVFTYTGETPPTAAPTPVTITVSNGVAPDLVIATQVHSTAVAPAAQPPKLSAAFPALIEATAGQVVTVNVAQYVESALPLAFSRAGAQLVTTIDPVTGVLTFTAPNPAPAVGTPPGAMTITVSNGVAPDLVISTAVRANPVVVAPDPTLVGLPSPRADSLRQAQLANLLVHSFSGKAGGGNPKVNGSDVNRPSDSHNIATVGIAAMNGVQTVSNGRTPLQYMQAQFRAWLDGPNTKAGNTMPAARGGVTMQRDLCFVVATAFARMTPALWGWFTAAERAKLTTCMLGIAVSAAYQNSDANPWVKPGGSTDERRIDGGQFGRNRVFNFIHPSSVIPFIVNAFLGGGAALRDYLNGWDRDVFAAECQARGLWEMWQTFRQQNSDPDPKSPSFGRAGPSKAQLEASLRNLKMTIGKPAATYRTEVAADAARLMIAEINQAWGGIIRPGLQGPITRVPKGYAATKAGDVGIFEPATVAGVKPAHSLPPRNAWVGRLTDMSKWSVWVAEGLAGQTGAPAELASTDGAGDAAGPRSDMQYASDGVWLVLMSTVTMAAQGILPRTDPALSAALAKQGRGARHMELLTIHGYRSFAKGGRHYSDNRNFDWIAGSPQEQAILGEVLYRLNSDIIQPWSVA